MLARAPGEPQGELNACQCGDGWPAPGCVYWLRSARGPNTKKAAQAAFSEGGGGGLGKAYEAHFGQYYVKQ